MRRRNGLAGMVLALCGRNIVAQRVLVRVPPETVGGWYRRELESTDVATAPEPRRSLNPKSWLHVKYTREQMLNQVDAFGFASSTAAPESAQKWCGHDGATVLMHCQVCVVCSSIDAGRAPLLEFSRDPEVAWFASSR